MSDWTRWGILAAAAAVCVSCSAPALRGRVAEGRYAFPDGVVSCPVPESMDGIQDGPNAVSLYQSGRLALYYGTWYSLFYVPLGKEGVDVALEDVDLAAGALDFAGLVSAEAEVGVQVGHFRQTHFFFKRLRARLAAASRSFFE